MKTVPSADHIAKELLQRSHSPDTATTIFNERVKQRPLILRPTSPDPTVNARAKRQHARIVKQRAQRKSNKPQPLSAKRRRALNLDEIPTEHQKYTIYEPLHELWCDYMRGILGLKDGSRKHVEAQAAGPLLTSADYHGAILEVTRSRCPSRVGLSGIVVKDTRFTFELITKSNQLKTVPKEHTMFRFTVPAPQHEIKPFTFEILGSQFEARAADRATKKFRLHLDPDT